MSRIRADYITNLAGTGAPEFSQGAVITGVVTATKFSASDLEVSSGGINAVGVVTAPSFKGTLIGASSAAAGLTGSPDITVNNLVGVAATFTGDVSVGGILTYEDVTNVDSIGIVTARTGIHVLAGGINAVGVVTATSFDGNVSGNVSGNVIGGTIVGTSASISGITTTSNLVVGNTVWTAISTTDTSKTIVNREYCTVVTSSASTTLGIDITLPASPQPGWEVGVAIAGTFLDTDIVRNGSNIMELAEDMTLNREYIAIQLVYVDANVGWRFF